MYIALVAQEMSVLPSWARCGVVALLVLPTSAEGAARPLAHWFSPRNNALFADARAQLQVLVDDDGHHVANRFCIVGERIGSTVQAYVHWPTENRLILWEPQQDNPRAIVGSRRNLDLTRDVVDGNDVEGSTYRLTRATANGILHACRENGTQYLVTKRERPHA